VRIAISYPHVNLMGGVERVVVESANHLARAGHEVHVLAADVAAGVLDPAIVVEPVRVRTRFDPAFALGFRRAATRVLEATGPYDVHAAFSALSPPGGVFWAPSVHAEVYDQILRWRSGAGALVQRANPFHRVRLRLERQLYAAGGYARVIAQTEQVKREAIAHYEVPETDVDVLPLGFDPAAFNPARRLELRAQQRTRFGFADEDRVVAFVANELERKGFDTLLEATVGTDVKLLVVGRAKPPDDPRIVYAGATDDVAVPLAAADAFALPTRYEPWGLVIVEALATGLPVVTTRVAGAAEVIRDGETGRLTDPGDAAAVREALEWALRPGGPAAPDRIAAGVAHLEWPKVLRRYEEILTRVAQGAGLTKPTGYYGAARADVVAGLPQPLGRTLDVGCGAGGVGRSLRAAGATELWGVEVVPEAAKEAAPVFDGLVVAPVEEALAGDRLPAPFDTIVCYDVLEHLVDPEAVLRGLLRLAAPGGHLHVSVPNARHFSLIRDLVMRGTFGYSEYGHRDVTHLRWFTRIDIVNAVREAGWEVLGTAPNTFRGKDRPFDRLTLGRTRELIALQWQVLARKPG
jgi:UDP-glucose:(heptosyl)LPS alpha-1,3-glucosyltransferase